MTEKDECDFKIATGRRLKLFRQLVGLSRKNMAKHIPVSPRKLKGFEDGQIKSMDSYSQLTDLYTVYGLNATFLFCGKGSIFATRGTMTPETIYWLANFVFPGEVEDIDLERLKKLIAILKKPETRREIFEPMMEVKLAITRHLAQ